MLRLIGFLVTFALGAAGFALVDYNAWRKAAVDEGRVGLSLRDYLDNLPDRYRRTPEVPAQVAGLPSDLAEMLPLAPTGWTMRPAVAEDAASFLPRDASVVPRSERRRIEGLVNPPNPNGPETVIQIYERGERRVVIHAVRHDDKLFTGPVTQNRLDLQALATRPELTPVMTVRGLDLWEDPLPGEMRGRLLVAYVGAQIHLQVLVSDRLEDADLLPLLETLNVKAMNASVVDKQEGLGDLPVIVVAAAMAEPLQEAFKADRAASKARQVEAADAIGTSAVDEASANQPPEAGFGADCDATESGIKRCTVSGN